MSTENQFVYETVCTSLPQLVKVFSILVDIRVTDIWMSVSSDCDEYIIEEIQDKIKRRRELLGKKRQSTKDRRLSKLDIPFEDLRQRKIKKILDLQGHAQTRIFINQYKKQLNDLGNEFDVGITIQNGTLCMYSNTQISSIFESQLFTMKKKLRMIFIHNEELYEKMNSSKYIRNELLKRDIRHFLLHRSKCVILHTSSLNEEGLKRVVALFSYDAMILKFYTKQYSVRVNQVHFMMLRKHVEPFLNYIQKIYEIRCEMSQKNMGIIVHIMDPIFSEEPKRQLTDYLSNIVFVTYFTKKSSLHLQHIQTNIPKSSSLQVTRSNYNIFLCWNRNKKIDRSEVTKVFQKMYEQIQDCSSNFKISYGMGKIQESLLHNIEQLAHKYRLICDYEISQKSQPSIVKIGFKSFNFLNKEERIKQYDDFLNEIITVKSQKQSNFQPAVATFAPKISKSSNQQNQKVNIQVFQDVLTHKQEQILPKKKQTKGLEIQIGKDGIIFEDLVDFSNNKRNRHIENLISSNFDIQCKVWNKCSENAPFSVKKPSKLSFYLTKQQKNGSFSKFTETDFLSFSTISKNEQYFLVLKTESSQYTVSHEMIVYNTP